MDEIEEFSELYFDDREEFWKRTVVVFTSIDELKGCVTLEDRVNKLETQIAKPGMEKVKKLLDQTNTECIYVSSIDHSDKRRFTKDLTNRMNSIVSDNNLLTQSLNNLEPVDIRPKPDDLSNDETPAVPRPLHVIPSAQLPLENSNCEISPINTEQLFSDSKFSDLIPINEPVSVYTTESLDSTISISNPDEIQFLQPLNQEQLLSLLQEMCKDKKVLKRCRKTHDTLFLTNLSPKPKKTKWSWMSWKFK